MNKTLLSCACVVLIFTSCSQQKPAPPELTQAPDVPSLEIPEKTAPPEPPAPPKPEQAPEIAPPPAMPTVGSTVWSVARISITTDDGILAIPPGLKLRVVRETETGYVVSDEKQEFPVTTTQVSLNSDAASSAAKADAAARSADTAWQRSQGGSRSGTPKNARAAQLVGELQTRYDQLVREEASLKAGIQRAHAEDTQAFQSANQRRVFTRSVSPSQAAAWRARLPVVQAEKERVFYELKKARM